MLIQLFSKKCSGKIQFFLFFWFQHKFFDFLCIKTGFTAYNWAENLRVNSNPIRKKAKNKTFFE